MAESLTLTTPVTPSAPTTSSYRVISLNLQWEAQRITVVVKDNNEKLLVVVYEGAQAVTLMTALNKANLTTNSLQRRILTQLAADGKLPAGTVTGAQD